MSSRVKRVLWFSLMFLLVAGIAWASEGGGGHGDKWMNFLYRVINFVLVVGIIYKLVGKRIKDFFSGRSHQIETELADLEARKAEADLKLKEVEEKIANLEQEREAILQAAKEQGEAVKAQIIEKAKKSAEQIKEQAKVTAEQEAKAAFEQVKAELADKIVEAAEKMIQERLSGDIHKKLINEYLTKVVIN